MNEEKFKAVVCNPDSGDGGIYTYYSAAANKCNSSFDTNFIDANPFTLAGVDDTHSPIALTPLLSQYLAAARDAYVRSLEVGANIVEVCDWPLSFVPAVLDQRVPYIVQCHGSVGQIAEHDPQKGDTLEVTLVQLLEPQLLRYAHRIQTYSEANKLYWERATGRSVNMIRPAFPLPALPREPVIDPVGRVFGRLQRWKGPHILCAALQYLGTRAPQIEWFGSIKPWEACAWPTDRRLAMDFPDIWQTNFHYRPALPRDQVFTLQASALFNVIPSTWDVFNFTVVESMAAARPTIASTGAGASELIIDGENGFTFENANAEALAIVIDRVLTMSETRRRNIGAAGRETIRIELDPVRIANERMRAYQEAIRSFHASPPPRAHDWLVRLLTPEDGKRDPDALLNHAPLRAIVRHIGRRTLAKLWTAPR